MHSEKGSWNVVHAMGVDNFCCAHLPIICKTEQTWFSLSKISLVWVFSCFVEARLLLYGKIGQSCCEVQHFWPQHTFKPCFHEVTVSAADFLALDKVVIINLFLLQHIVEIWLQSSETGSFPVLSLHIGYATIQEKLLKLVTLLSLLGVSYSSSGPLAGVWNRLRLAAVCAVKSPSGRVNFFLFLWVLWLMLSIKRHFFSLWYSIVWLILQYQCIFMVSWQEVMIVKLTCTSAIFITFITDHLCMFLTENKCLVVWN